MATLPVLRNKKIILAVTGCIAAYKSAELLRMLRKAGADVWVAMTSSAQQFITPLTMRTLSGNPCITQMFDPAMSSMPLPHISLSDGADLLLVAPATANIIGKAANGIADDIVSTLVLSCDCPKVFAPAMNTKMWRNPAVKENTARIKKSGITIVGPAAGELACGLDGEGRLAEPAQIFEKVCALIGAKQDLAGKKILVTAGGTREAIDKVRFIGNRSSGKMGYAVAEAAARRGAEVTLISTPTSLDAPEGASIRYVNSAQELKAEVEKEFKNSDALVMAAAVADFRPAKTFSGKIKKDSGPAALELVPTSDILFTLGRIKGKRKLAGFALESENLASNARKKLREKNLDLIVANGTGAFDSDESSVMIIDKSGKTKKYPPQKKTETAEKILDALF